MLLIESGILICVIFVQPENALTERSFTPFRMSALLTGYLSQYSVHGCSPFMEPIPEIVRSPSSYSAQ